MEKFALLVFENGIVFPPAPGDVAVTITVAPDLTAVAVPGMSRLIDVTILFPSVVVFELRTTFPVAVPEATKVNVCPPITNCCPAVEQPVVKVIVP